MVPKSSYKPKELKEIYTNNRDAIPGKNSREY
jgi:hypothetical protein